MLFRLMAVLLWKEKEKKSGGSVGKKRRLKKIKVVK